MSRRLCHHSVLILAAAGIIALTGGCPLIPPPPGDSGDPALYRFESSDEMLSFFKNQVLTQRPAAWRGGFLAGGAPEALAEDSADGGGQNGDYSTTNLQEAGVDESDVLKSDGTYFCIVSDMSVRIVRGAPPDEMEQVAQVDFDVSIDAMYLLDAKLIVVGHDYDADRSAPDEPAMDTFLWPPYYESTSVIVYEVDITDPTEPAITGEIEFDGSLASSRLTGGRLFLVLTYVPETPDNPTVLNLAPVTLDVVLPKARRGDEVVNMVEWQDCYHPGSGDGYRMTSVVTLDAADIEQVLGSVGIMADAGTVYASTEALYVTDDEYDAASDFRLRTAVHKLTFGDQGAAQYVGTGVVPGRLLNQFSLGEHDGNLRVATHVEGDWLFGSGVGVGMAVAEAGGEAVEQTAQRNNADGPSNAVYVLGESDGTLEVLGSVEGIAPGEDLYAARFMGERGYLITFEQIDPLFVLDLSDPTDPTVLGELEIPGYSEYLHPFGEDRLIGIGREVAETEWGFAEPRGVQLTLFDISDPTAPTLVEQVNLGGFYSSSEVSSTHKAVTFMPDDGLLAIPARLTDEQFDWGDQYTQVFDGVICFTVTADGFEELGRVDSVVSGVEQDEPPYWMWRAWGDGMWRRPAVIGETVYAVSPDGVRAAPLSDFEATTTVELTGQ